MLEARLAQAKEALAEQERRLDLLRKRDAPRHYLERQAEVIEDAQARVDIIEKALEDREDEEPTRERRPSPTPPGYEQYNGAPAYEPSPRAEPGPAEPETEFEPTVPEVSLPELPSIDLPEIPEIDTGRIGAFAILGLVVMLVVSIAS